MPTGLLIAAGLGLAAAGTITQVNAAHRQAEFQQQEIEAQQRAEAQRRQAMELDAKRKSLEITRNQQRYRSMALATTTAQGANISSALPGAFGQVSGQANTQQLANDQNLQIGRNIYDINQQVSQARIGIAQAQGDAAFGAGLSTMGGALISSAGTISKVGQSAYAGFQRSMSFGTGPGSGYGWSR